MIEWFGDIFWIMMRWWFDKKNKNLRIGDDDMRMGNLWVFDRRLYNVSNCGGMGNCGILWKLMKWWLVEWSVTGFYGCLYSIGYCGSV